MTSRRTYQGAQPLLEIRRDEVERKCVPAYAEWDARRKEAKERGEKVEPWCFDVLQDYTWGPRFDKALPQAQILCATCPMAATCLRDPENRKEPWRLAVLGRSKPGPTKHASCGTRGGYSKHRRQGEVACAACKAAENARNQERSRKRHPDESKILRRMAGEQVRVTGAEASEVVRRMFLAGMSMTEIRKVTRLKPERYWRASELGVVA